MEGISSKESTVMRMEEDGSARMIEEVAIVQLKERRSRMWPQVICASESLLSWHEGWLSVLCVLTGSNKLLLLGIVTLVSR